MTTLKLQKLEKLINSELSSKINNSSMVNEELMIEIGENYLVDVVQFLKSNEKLLNSLSKIADTFGLEPSTVAVAWLLAHPANILPVLGTNSLSRIETISQALDIKLDRQTWFEIYTTALGREVA